MNLCGYSFYWSQPKSTIFPCVPLRLCVFAWEVPHSFHHFLERQQRLYRIRNRSNIFERKAELLIYFLHSDCSLVNLDKLQYRAENTALVERRFLVGDKRSGHPVIPQTYFFKAQLSGHSA